MAGKKHYTESEKSLFLRILKTYAHVIENKKSDGTAIHAKAEAWQQIVEEYNNSSIISTQRTVEQLKKWWSNLKNTQRGALTKEKQSRLATGGGPQEEPAEVDPEITMIAPHLMTIAPTIFSSNLPQEVIKNRRDAIFLDDFTVDDITGEPESQIYTANDSSFKSSTSSVIENDNSADSAGVSKNYSRNLINSESTSVTTAQQPSQGNSSSVLMPKIDSSHQSPVTPKPPSLKRPLQWSQNRTPPQKMSKKNVFEDNKENIDERNLKLDRLRHLTQREEELAELKMRHQELKHKMEIDFLREKYSLELRSAAAAAELSEVLLKKRTCD